MNIAEGDSGIRVECPEIGVGVGLMSDDSAKRTEIAKKAIYGMVFANAFALIKRVGLGSAPQNATPEQIAIARKILEAKEKGIEMSELFRK